MNSWLAQNGEGLLSCASAGGDLQKRERETAKELLRNSAADRNYSSIEIYAGIVRKGMDCSSGATFSVEKGSEMKRLEPLELEEKEERE